MPGVSLSRRPLAVFAGPSLPPDDRPVVPGVDYLAPARRGDVLAAAQRYERVLLIDGVFHHDLAPSPKEVYEATRIATLYGAASMGALRGAECAPYGMICLGAIARWYRCGVIDGDDEVAVLVDPRTQRALTVPMVDVRFWVRHARRSGALSSSEAQDVLARVHDVYYMDRDMAAVTAVCPTLPCGPSLKQIDARSALRTVCRR